MVFTFLFPFLTKYKISHFFILKKSELFLSHIVSERTTLANFSTNQSSVYRLKDKHWTLIGSRARKSFFDECGVGK